MKRKGVDIRLDAAVQSVRRNPADVEVKTWAGEWETFDEVVFATHSDDTLAMLSDTSPAERSALGAVKYQPNHVTLHADTNLLPKQRKVWASWMYCTDKGDASDAIDLTYWMNSLQPIPMDDLHFVTLNNKREIREELIYDQVTLRHPVYDMGALAAQKQIAEMNGLRNTWFCGAWMRNGFHEDGLATAMTVVDAITEKAVLPIAAE